MADRSRSCRLRTNSSSRARLKPTSATSTTARTAETSFCARRAPAGPRDRREALGHLATKSGRGASAKSRGDLNNFALYNAPPGTMQRMPVYFYLSSADSHATQQAVMALTHDDVYKPMPGFKVLVSHFHFHFNEQLTDVGTMDFQPTWLPVFRELGINIAILADFHWDSHPTDTGKIRLNEQKVYFEGCQRFSDRDFLLIPGEEPDANFGGHYMFVFPTAALLHARKAAGNGEAAQPFVEESGAMRQGLSHQHRARRTGSAEKGERPGLADASAHQGLDGISRRGAREGLLPQRPLSGRIVPVAAGRSVAEASLRGALPRPARRHEQLDRSEVHDRRGRHVHEVSGRRNLPAVDGELRQAGLASRSSTTAGHRSWIRFAPATIS